jgi:hypothetical protein
MKSLEQEAENGISDSLTLSDIKDIFSCWEVIYRCHNKLLTNLNLRMKTWDKTPLIGDIFATQVGYFNNLVDRLNVI